MQSNQAGRFHLNSVKLLGTATALALLFFLAASRLPAQRGRINGPIDNNRRVGLSGHINPRARAGVDRGRADASKILPYVTMVLKQTPSQQADLEQLLAEQQ